MKVYVVTSEDPYEPDADAIVIGAYTTRELAVAGAIAYARRVLGNANRPLGGTEIHETALDG